MLYEISKLNKVDIGHHGVGPEGVGHGVEPKEVCNRRHQAINRHEKSVGEDYQKPEDQKIKLVSQGVPISTSESSKCLRVTTHLSETV